MTTPNENQFAGRIVRMSAENVKRLNSVEITPHGDVVVIGGNNGAGKSSILDAIQMALGGKDEIPGQPVRKGQKKAKVEIDLGNIIVRRTFTAEGGTSLVVENKDGARYPGPQAMLDELTGKIAFDPVSFLKLDAKKQLEDLRKLVGIDLSPLDARRKALYDERTLVNREADRLEGHATSLPSYPELPEFPVSVTELSKELEAARAKNRENDLFRARVAEGCRAHAVLMDVEKRLLAEIERLKVELVRMEQAHRDYQNKIDHSTTAVEAMKDAAAALVVIDTSPILNRMADAEATNKKIQANVTRSDAMDAAAKRRAESKALTEKIEAIDTAKADMLAKAPFPVAGLGFDENGVTFDGLPLDQASQAEQIRVAVAIGAALNTKLRVLLVRDGSLLDKNSLALLGALAKEKGLQVWLEVVSDGEHVQVEITDGSVSKVRVPAEATAELALT